MSNGVFFSEAKKQLETKLVMWPKIDELKAMYHFDETIYLYENADVTYW